MHNEINLKESIAENLNKEDKSLLSNLRKIKCTILDNGYRKIKTDFKFYNNDFQEPICEYCFENCYSEIKTQYENSNFISEKIDAICSCGAKSHQIKKFLDFSKKKEADGNCPYMELNNNSNIDFYYIDNKTNLKICFICLNFCKYEDDISRYNNSSKNKSSINNVCECKKIFHHDTKNILNELILGEGQKFIKFENISQTQFLNLIFKSETSFNILFENYRSYFRNLNSIEASINLNSVDTSNFKDVNKSLKFDLYLDVLAKLSDKCFRVNYFNEKIALDFDQKLIRSIMNIKSSYHSSNMWKFKLNFITIFLNTNFKRENTFIPNMKVNDLELLNPFQRLMIFENIKSQNDLFKKYYNISNFDFLEFTLENLLYLNSIRQKFEVSYKLIKKLIYICKIYAKYNLFNNDKAKRYTTIIDEFLFNFANSIKNCSEKKLKNSLFDLQIGFIKQILKSLIYLNYWFNDIIVEKYIRKFQNLTFNLKFFNSNFDLTRFISKNTINCLTYFLDIPLIDDHDHKSIKKNKETLMNITSLLKNFIYTQDNYSTGLKRILNKNNNIYFNYFINILNPEEYSFVEKTRILANNIEGEINKFFNFESDYISLINFIRDTIKNIFELMNLGVFKHAEYKNNEMVSSFSEIDNENLNQSEYISLGQITGKNLDSPSEKLYNNSQKNMPLDKFKLGKLENNLSSNENIEIKKEINYVNGNYKILLNKSFIMYSVIKIIKVSYSRMIVKIQKNNKQKYNNEENISKESNSNQSRKSSIINENIYEDFSIDNFLFGDIINLLYFYVENNPDNSMIMLCSDFLRPFGLFTNEQLNESLNIIYIALKNIVRSNYEITHHKYILNYFKKVLKKLKLNPETFDKDFTIIQKFFKLLKLSTKINFLNHASVTNKMRKFVEKLYHKFDFISNTIEILGGCKLKNIKLRSEFDTDLISLREIYKESKIISLDDKVQVINVDSENEINKREEKTFSYNNLISENNDDNLKTGDFNEEDLYNINGMKTRNLIKILRYFLSLTNTLFDGDATLDKKKFLCKIIDIKDIYYILKRKSLDIELRKEL